MRTTLIWEYPLLNVILILVKKDINNKAKLLSTKDKKTNNSKSKTVNKSKTNVKK